MNQSIVTIAKLFSTGHFSDAYDYLSADIVWSIIGENTLTGKKVVINHCQKVASYFESIEIDFTTDEIIATDNNVIVMGTAKFIVEGKVESSISACDVYMFDEGKIKSVTSYCLKTV